MTFEEAVVADRDEWKRKYEEVLADRDKLEEAFSDGLDILQSETNCRMWQSEKLSKISAIVDGCIAGIDPDAAYSEYETDPIATLKEIRALLDSPWNQEITS
jgi:hypothetical protein